ncbi:MAG: cobyrinate a,c-diamide synthase [Thermodesulfobacteriota bacterium]
MNYLSPPRILVAALRGGAGKTLLSLALISAFKKQGKKVVPFKKGPDYIDAAWLTLAAQNLCHNLDLFLMEREAIQYSFWKHALDAELSIVEGNRGLYDGLDAEGSQSTAALAKLIATPVILIVDGDKITRTAAALVLGCQKIDAQVNIQGVILNKIARSRHEEVMRKAIESVCHVPVLGAIPRFPKFLFPERHLGLIPPWEYNFVADALERAQELVVNNVNLERIWEIAQSAPPPGEEILTRIGEMEANVVKGESHKKFTIGVIKDSAFQFYYPENLEALEKRGATILEISAIKEKLLPAVDALYIGGGFPETHAEYLANNHSFRNSLRQAVEGGLPVYAECGGLMFLGESLTIDTKNYPMVGALPIAFAMERQPQGHGYTILQVNKRNPFFPLGLHLHGHEFHYSRVLWFKEDPAYFACRVKRGVGIDGQMDGFCYNNILGMFSHIHVAGCPKWADGLAKSAMANRLREKVTRKKSQNFRELRP